MKATNEKQVILPGNVPVALSVLAQCAEVLNFEATNLENERSDSAPLAQDRANRATAYRLGADALSTVVKIVEESPEPVALRLRPRAELNREDFLARCGTAYDMGLASPARLALLERWTDLALRAVAVAVGTAMPGGIYHQHGTRHQAQIVDDLLASEVERLRERAGGGQPLVLASDADGYSLCRLAAVLNHPCQECATTEGRHHTTTAMHSHDNAPAMAAH